jgi:hypothetical protein
VVVVLPAQRIQNVMLLLLWLALPLRHEILYPMMIYWYGNEFKKHFGERRSFFIKKKEHFSYTINQHTISTRIDSLKLLMENNGKGGEGKKAITKYKLYLLVSFINCLLPTHNPIIITQY